MPARMRFPAQALEELRKTDPDTPVSLKMIRSLVKTGVIPSIPVGNGNRRLLNFDALLEYLEHPSRDMETPMPGIRKLDERAGR